MIAVRRKLLAAASSNDERGAAHYNLGTALWALEERESGARRLEEAVAAYCAALQELSRDRVLLDWAATQNNLGTALWTLGERESGTARLREAPAAFDACLTVTKTAWPEELAWQVRALRDETRAEIARRRATEKWARKSRNPGGFALRARVLKRSRPDKALAQVEERSCRNVVSSASMTIS